MAEITGRLSALLADRYRIERRLGEGGMATVYLAEDLKHDRKVALKVLRPELAAVLGADRFVQEIKTTAQLQHPHILPLYDSGSLASTPDGHTEFLYYVMPYIQGETLREKLNREVQLGIDDAVRITSEVAEALHYAHEQGVIHRDIKPENILLQNGRAMVADFGIALAVSAAAGGRMTETGLSLGTPHYMSPEQATADRQITSRSDIFSLGSVLYEMLTGEPPHTGSSAQAIIMKIVTDEVRPVQELRKTVPPHVAAAVAKAVAKLPADRFESAKAFAEALHNPGLAPAIASAGSTSRRILLPALATVAVLMAAVAAWGWTRPNGSRPVARYTTTLGAAGDLDGITLRVETALSPDGALLVFRSPLTGPGQLYIKRRDEVSARPLAGTEGGSGPFFSPDGAWIGFVAKGELRKVPVAGGEPFKIAASVKAQYNHGAWLDDGTIIFYNVGTNSLLRLRSGDAKPQVVASPATLEGRFPWLPTPLPGGRGFLFTAHQTNCVGPVSCRPSRVYVYDLQRDSARTLFEDAVGAWYVKTGHVLYLTSAGTLMAVRWDNDKLVATGKPVPIIDGIQAPGLVLSDEGTALYLMGPPEFTPEPKPNATLVWVDRSGRMEPVDSTWQVNTGGRYRGDLSFGWGLALSPDGRRIALTLLTEQGTDIWIKQLPTGPATRLTLDPGEDRAPAWTADGRSVTFLSDRPTSANGERKAGRLSLWQQPADGTGEPRLLWGKDAPSDGFTSRDGQWTVLSAAAASSSSTAGEDILAVRTGVDSVARHLVASGFDETGATLSPDSRWLAYVSNEQGAREVFVRPFPDVNGGKWQLSSGGGSAPVWAHSGRELFYTKGRNVYAVRIAPGPSFSAEPARVLFTVPFDMRVNLPFRGAFAVSPDDQRFLMVKDNSWESMAGARTLVVLENFFAELRSKVGK